MINIKECFTNEDNTLQYLNIKGQGFISRFTGFISCFSDHKADFQKSFFFNAVCLTTTDRGFILLQCTFTTCF